MTDPRRTTNTTRALQGELSVQQTQRADNRVPLHVMISKMEILDAALSRARNGIRRNAVGVPFPNRIATSHFSHKPGP